jgi:hypothetical protein
MTDERMKELIPDIEYYNGGNGFMQPDTEQIRQQTENLRKAVKALEKIIDNIESTPGHSSMVESEDAREENWNIAYDAIEQITGK